MIPSNIYHLKLEDTNPHNHLARCNSRDTKHWRMYTQKNFIEGKTFNLKEGGFTEIRGKRCKRCWKLYNRDVHKS